MNSNRMLLLPILQIGGITAHLCSATFAKNQPASSISCTEVSARLHGLHPVHAWNALVAAVGPSRYKRL